MKGVKASASEQDICTVLLNTETSMDNSESKEKSMKPKAIKPKHEHEYDAEDVFLNVCQGAVAALLVTILIYNIFV
ncbi:MAG: hypothetical protein HUJ16_11135 [Kangiella sp.]|nr:hypothetical protein [Kangiella sp.]